MRSPTKTKARSKSPAQEPKGEVALRDEIAEIVRTSSNRSEIYDRVLAAQSRAGVNPTPAASNTATGAEDPSRTWSETHCGTLAYYQPDSACNLQRRVRRVPSGLHSSTAVAVVIRGLESLSETLPALLRAASDVPASVPNPLRHSLISAIDMLTTYRNHRESREMESDGRMISEALDTAKQEGVALGIEQEKQRVKEARRGRGRK